MSDHLYRRLIRSILTSPPDQRIGSEPKELLEFARKAFTFELERHETIVSEEEHHKPKYELMVQILEARDLELCREHRSPYCLLALLNTKTEFRPPSPSWSAPRRRQSVEGIAFSSAETIENVQFTKCVLGVSSSPKWRDEFFFKVGDDLSKYLNICVVSVDPTSKPKDALKLSPTSLIRNWWQAVLPGKSCEDCLLSTSISLKELPIGRWVDRWSPLQRAHKRHTGDGRRQPPALHLRMKLTFKLTTQQEDPEADDVSMSELILLMERFHKISATKQRRDYKNSSLYCGELNEHCESILCLFCCFNRICPLTRDILSLGIVLRWNSESLGELPVGDEVIMTMLQRVYNSLIASPFIRTKSFSYDNYSTENNTMEMELTFLHEALTSFTRDFFARLKLPFSTFPPCSGGQLTQLEKSLSVVVSLCTSNIWEMSEETKKPVFQLKECLEELLESDSLCWLLERLKTIEDVEVFALRDAERVLEILEDISDQFDSYSDGVLVFFRSFLVDYPSVVFRTCDAQLSASCEKVVCRLRRLQRGSGRDADKLELASRTSIHLFRGLRRLSRIITAAVDPSLNLGLVNFEVWFEECLTFWFQNWADKTSLFVHRALKQDLNLERASADVNFAESVVTLLAINKGVCDEFIQLELTVPELRGMAVLKVTDIVCDNTLQYAKHVVDRLKSDEEDASSVVKLSRAANSVQYAAEYLKDKIPIFLDHENILSSGPSSQSLRLTGKRLIWTSYQSAHSIAVELVGILVIKFWKKTKRSWTMEASRQWSAEKIKSVMFRVLLIERGESFVAHLEKILQSLEGSLLPALLPSALSKFWTLIFTFLSQQLESGEPPEYYQLIRDQVLSLHELFEQVAVDFARTPSAEPLLRRLHFSSQRTQDLLLQYFSSLADESSSVEDETNSCVLDLKIGYFRLTNEKISIFIKVLAGHNFPLSDASAGSGGEPYVMLLLRPAPLFCHECASTFVSVGSQPNFNQIFHFDVDEDDFYIHGAVLCVYGLKRDRWSSSDLVGRAVLHLARIPEIQWIQSPEISLDSVPTSRLPLLYLHRPQSAIMKVLEERKVNDKLAKTFLEEEKYMIKYRSQPPTWRRTHAPSCSCGLRWRLHNFLTRRTEYFHKLSRPSQFNFDK